MSGNIGNGPRLLPGPGNGMRYVAKPLNTRIINENITVDPRSGSDGENGAKNIESVPRFALGL
jgi:hypothetical protein